MCTVTIPMKPTYRDPSQLQHGTSTFSAPTTRSFPITLLRERGRHLYRSIPDTPKSPTTTPHRQEKPHHNKATPYKTPTSSMLELEQTCAGGSKGTAMDMVHHKLRQMYAPPVPYVVAYGHLYLLHTRLTASIYMLLNDAAVAPLALFSGG